MSSVTGAFNVDGLVSGLNTTQIVAQLIAIEARPQTLTRARLTKFSDQDTALASIKTKLATLKASALSVSTGADWGALKATSSDTDTVSVTATSASGVGSLKFTVDSLASSDAYTSDWTVADPSAAIVADPGGGAPRTITVGVGSDSRTINVGNGSLDSVVNAINGQSNFKLSASAIKVGTNSYRLQLSASEAGVANTVTFTAGQFSPTSAGWLHVATASDAQITVGTGLNSYQVRGNSNQLVDVLPGVTMNLKRTSLTAITVSSGRDADALATKIQTMVDDFNKAIVEIGVQTKYDASAKKAAPLLDSSSIRQVRQLISTAVSGTSGTNNASLAGITLARDGTITFDKAKFVEQYTKDPAATQALFNDGPDAGLGKRIYDVADRAVNPDGGLLTSAQDAARATVAALQVSIDSMQGRLDKHAVFLRRRFNAMETALNSLRQQGTFLSNQLK